MGVLMSHKNCLLRQNLKKLILYGETKNLSFPTRIDFLFRNKGSCLVGNDAHAYEIASLIEKYGATLYKSENFAILKYCYDNYASNPMLNHILRTPPLSKKRIIFSGVYGRRK